MEQCFPAKNAEDIRELDGKRSATYDFMPKHDQHFLRPEGKLIHPRGAPCYLVASLAQAKPGIGTAYLPSKVIDLTRGLLNTLTTGSFPWVLDTIEGKPCIRLLTLCEAFRAYRTRIRWPPLGANNDSKFWRRQLAQSIPQNVAAAITYIIERALLRPDREGKSALTRIRDNTPLDLPKTTQARVEALVQTCFQPRDLNPFPQRRKYGVCWQEILDALTLRHPKFQDRRLCPRYQLNVCKDGPKCGLVHLCHSCLIRHPHDQECQQARAWRQTRESEIHLTPEQVKTYAFHRLTAPLGIWDRMVLPYSQTLVLLRNQACPRGYPWRTAAEPGEQDADSMNLNWQAIRPATCTETEPAWATPASILVRPPTGPGQPTLIGVVARNTPAETHYGRGLTNIDLLPRTVKPNGLRGSG